MKLSAKYLGFAVLGLLGLILALSPVDKLSQIEVSAEQMIYKINNRSNYITADEVAHMVIDKDPSIQLIDIRSEQDFNDYHIPGSFSMPLDKMLTDDYHTILNQAKNIVLVSNGNTKAGQAWILLQSIGFTEVFILQGGMNNWVQTFSNPSAPDDVASDDEVFRYQFRKAAGSALMGGEQISHDTEVSTPKLRTTIKKKTKKNKDEGC